MAEVRFRDLRRKLEQNGWVVDRIRGSHFVFAGPDRPTIAIPVHGGRCKPVYERIVDKAVAAIEPRRSED